MTGLGEYPQRNRRETISIAEGALVGGSNGYQWKGQGFAKGRAKGVPGEEQKEYHWKSVGVPP